MGSRHAIIETVGAGDLVFDVGANLGNKAAWFVERGARVVCVEPQPPLVAELRRRFAACPDVTIVPKGLARAPGTAKMSVCADSHVLSTFAPHWTEGRFAGMRWGEPVEVEVTTLDALVAEYGIPKYCKIDVEGFEIEVVAGLTSRLGRISFEFTSEYLSHAGVVVERLMTLGYDDFNLSLGEAETFHWQHWVKRPVLYGELNRLTQTTPSLWGDIYAD